MIDIAGIRPRNCPKNRLKGWYSGLNRVLQGGRWLLGLAAVVMMQACAVPSVISETPIVSDELREDIVETVEAERERLDAFPDLPDASTDEPEGGSAEQVPGALTERVMRERETVFDPYVITAHKPNFILPLAYASQINESVYTDAAEEGDSGFEHVEVKFQISLKTQLNESDLFLKDDVLSVAITLEAWWQLYSDELSSPFRETNYQPEIFYLKPLLWGPFGGSTAWLLGFEHQSNGQFQALSRSWNRLYTGLIFERGDFVMQLRPWYRIPEPEKESPEDADGDDNPDILDFMGHGDLRMSLRIGSREYSALIRGNPTTGKGAINLSWTFPLFGKFRGLVDYFNGYGDSLIDYDHHQQRFGIGVALTPLL